MQNAAFKALGLPHYYVPFLVRSEQLKDALHAIRVLGLAGVNVTIPHKEAVIPFLDEMDEEARRIGAVNTIQRDGNRLLGYNTDGRGFIQSLLENGVDPSGKRVILLGGGGAARGVAYALLAAHAAELLILTRSPHTGSALAERLTTFFPKAAIFSGKMGMATLPSSRPTLLINATPLGMKEGDPIPYATEQIQPEWIVSDLIYRPDETPLLAEAKKRGARIVPGMGMLLHQGGLAFEIWMRKPAPIPAMRQALEAALQRS